MNVYLNQNPLLNQKQERILFLYSAPTSGHKKCSDAVRAALKSAEPSNVQTNGIDAVSYFYPILGSFITKAYLEMLRYTPQLWDYLYDNPNIEELTRELRQLFHLFNSTKLKALFAKYQPTALACTHALLCGAIAQEKRKGECRLPLIAIVTDFAVHSYWIYPEVDLYIVANKESYQRLIGRGISKEKISVCGIPIEPAFVKKNDSELAKKKLGLDPKKPAVLVMGGSYGFGPLADILHQIAALHPIPQILAVTGTNRELKKEISRNPKFKNVRTYGYTKKISSLMDAATLLVTKPGGMTSSEALAKSLPAVLISPVPGQEERNARYLTKNGAAILAAKIGEVKEILKQLLSRPESLKRISERAQRIAAPQAASGAAQAILSLLKREENKSRESTLANLYRKNVNPEPQIVPVLEKMTS